MCLRQLKLQRKDNTNIKHCFVRLIKNCLEKLGSIFNRWHGACLWQGNNNSLHFIPLCVSLKIISIIAFIIKHIIKTQGIFWNYKPKIRRRKSMKVRLSKILLKLLLWLKWDKPFVKLRESRAMFLLVNILDTEFILCFYWVMQFNLRISNKELMYINLG